MSELFDKSIRTLELPRVLQLLSEQAVSPEAKELALAVRPVQQVLYRLDPGKTRRPPQDDHGPCAVGLIQQTQHVLIICFRPNRQRQFFGLRTDRLLRQ